MRSRLSHALLTAALLVTVALPAFAAGRGWLGVTTQATDTDLRRGLDLDRDGLLVNRVEEGSPADKAGLRKGDVILSYNSRSVTEPSELRSLVRNTEPGRSGALGIWRDGERRTLDFTVGAVPEGDDDDGVLAVPAPPSAPRTPRAPRAPRAPRGDDGDVHRRVIINGREVPEDEIDGKLKDLDLKIFDKDGPVDLKGLKGLKGLGGLEGMHRLEGLADMQGFSTGRGRLGVRVESLNSELAEALGATGDNGVLVVQVMEDTPAQKAGLRAGDIIVKIDGASVDSPSELVKELGERDGSVSVRVLRKGVAKDLTAEIERGSSRDEGDVRVRVAPRIRIRDGNPEPGRGPKVYRWNTNDGAGESAELREELRQLKQELRELREQMRERK
ncbi:MAG: PDZ domain-containing protein [Candidatus Eisenbacteria bacterium]